MILEAEEFLKNIDKEILSTDISISSSPIYNPCDKEMIILIDNLRNFFTAWKQFTIIMQTKYKEFIKRKTREVLKKGFHELKIYTYILMSKEKQIEKSTKSRIIKHFFGIWNKKIRISYIIDIIIKYKEQNLRSILKSAMQSWRFFSYFHKKTTKLIRNLFNKLQVFASLNLKRKLMLRKIIIRQTFKTMYKLISTNHGITQRLRVLKKEFGTPNDFSGDSNKENQSINTNSNYPISQSELIVQNYITFGKNDNTENIISEEDMKNSKVFKKISNNINTNYVDTENIRKNLCGKIIKNKRNYLVKPLMKLQSDFTEDENKDHIRIIEWRKKVQRSQSKKRKYKEMKYNEIVNSKVLKNANDLTKEYEKLKQDLIKEKKKQNQLLLEKMSLQKEVIESSILIE